MKKYSHAWIAFLAIKRLDALRFLVPEKTNSDITLRKDANSLVKWFKDYRDFVIAGAWYPDEVFKDMGTSHILKYKPYREGDKTRYSEFRPLPDTMECYALGRESPLFGQPYSIEDGNLADRCESLAHGLVDSFKMLHREDKGCPISPSANHIATRFFILSHYIADCHMPLHCDVRSFSSGKDIHGAIEKSWDDDIRKSYELDTDNERFFYDKYGYPLRTARGKEWLAHVEEQVITRPYVHSWGTANRKNGALRDNRSTWDYMSAVSAYSYLLAYRMIPLGYDESNIDKTVFRNLDTGLPFERYSEMIFLDAIDSVSRVWLHAWARYRRWAEKKG